MKKDQKQEQKLSNQLQRHGKRKMGVEEVGTEQIEEKVSDFVS